MKKTKKQGLIRRAARSWGRDMKGAIRSGLAIDAQREGADLIRGGVRSITSSTRALHSRPRDLSGPEAPDMSDFGQVLAHWGITWAQLPQVIRGMCIEIGAWAVLWVVGVGVEAWLYAGSGSWLNLYGAMVLTGGAVVLLTTRTWRVGVLRRREFVPFWCWFWGREWAGQPQFIGGEDNG